MSRHTSPVIQAKDINVHFGSQRVLNDVSLALEDGTIHGIVGPNGSGKTTFLNVLSGFIPQASGVVRVRETAVKKGNPRLSSRSGIGRTFQSVRLFPRLTVRENIEIGALARGFSSPQARTIGESLMARFGLEEIEGTIAGTVPYGTERLISVARAIAGKPVVLLLDEPCAGLDESETDELLEILREINIEFDCAMIIVEHDMRFIADLCSTVQVLVNGQTLVSGSPAEALSQQMVIDSYLGT